MVNWHSAQYVVSLVTSVVNIVVPHALLGICTVYVVSLLQSAYEPFANLCKIHSFILVCGCSLKKKMFLSRKLLGLWGALEAIIFIWACRTNLAEKDDEARFLILTFYL